jgi:hypothetical protein
MADVEYYGPDEDPGKWLVYYSGEEPPSLGLMCAGSEDSGGEAIVLFSIPEATYPGNEVYGDAEEDCYYYAQELDLSEYGLEDYDVQPFVSNFKYELREWDDWGMVNPDVPVKSIEGATIANNWDDLWDGYIEQSLEEAGVLPDDAWWSGTTKYGYVYEGQTCDGFYGPWDSTEGYGRVGYSDIEDGRWVDASYSNCSISRPVICAAYNEYN